MSDTFWLTIISQLQHAAVIISVVLFFFIPSSGRRRYIELGLLVIFSMICESSSWIGALVFHKNMNLASNLLTMVAFPLILLMYRKHLPWRYISPVTYTLIIAFTIFALINLFYIQGVMVINSYPRAAASFSYIILAITYILGHAQEMPVHLRLKHPMYWVSVGILIYNCVVIYISLWVDYLVNVKNNRLIEVYVVHNLIGVAFYVMIWRALILIRKQQPSLN